MGPLSRREMILGFLVALAVLMWIFGGHYVEATTAALIVLALMLATRVVAWEDMAANKAAWTTLSLLALLVTLASGLSRTGFIKWFADAVATHMGGLSPTLSLLALVSIYFFSHYMFASITAHTTAMLPVMLAVGMGIPGLPVATLAHGARGHARHHGGHHALCDRAGARLLRERLSADGGVLEARHPLRPFVPRCAPRHRRSAPAHARMTFGRDRGYHALKYSAG